MYAYIDLQYPADVANVGRAYEPLHMYYLMMTFLRGFVEQPAVTWTNRCRVSLQQVIFRGQ